MRNNYGNVIHIAHYTLNKNCSLKSEFNFDGLRCPKVGSAIWHTYVYGREEQRYLQFSETIL